MVGASGRDSGGEILFIFMTDDTKILIALGLLWLLWKPSGSTSVNIPGVSQICYDFAGNPYEWPVSSGPCPTS